MLVRYSKYTKLNLVNQICCYFDNILKKDLLHKIILGKSRISLSWLLGWNTKLGSSLSKKINKRKNEGHVYANLIMLVQNFSDVCIAGKKHSFYIFIISYHFIFRAKHFFSRIDLSSKHIFKNNKVFIYLPF